MAQVKKEHIRHKILEVTRNELLAHGYEKMSMRKIASQTSISVSNLYNYFRTKEAIVEELISDCYNQILHVENWDVPMPELTDPDKFLSYLQDITTYVSEWVEENRVNLTILLTKVKGSRFEDFRNRFIANYVVFELHSVDEITKAIKNPFARTPSEELIGQMILMYFHVIEVYLGENKNREWLESRLDELNLFVAGGIGRFLS